MTSLFLDIAPVVATFHAAGDSASYRIFTGIVRFLADHIDARVTVSKDALELAERYLPGQYEVLFNGVNIKNLEPFWYHQQIGIVQQEPVLFSGTIKENIIYGWDCSLLTSEQITQRLDEATKMSNAYDFIHDVDMFPKGYDTQVGERGLTLSGGQKQRTAIARAIAVDPKVLVLDDALSAVDTYTEEEILQRLGSVMRARTSIIVSHRISTVRNADQILVLEAGVIEERGTHAQLLALGGRYAQMWALQKVDTAPML